ncbi:MAG TPA: rRNA maturation RNase YbeY, partial [Nitrospirota bacterium]
MAVRLTNSQRNIKVPASRLRKAAGEALSLLGFQDAELSVLVTGDRKMRALNRAYRGMDKTTDVLSFPAMPGEELSALRETPPGTSGGRPPVVLG